MSIQLIRLPRLLFLTCLLAFVAPSIAAPVDLKLEAILIWGTNEPHPGDPKLKPVDADLEKKLKKSPFKWKYYFEVNREKFSVSESNKKKVEMSKQCEIQVENLGKSLVGVELFGKGKSAGKVKQRLPKEEILVIGGNAENTTSWFVVLRQND